MTNYDIVLWSVLSGPFVYLLAILFSPTPASRRDYHYADRRLTPQEYVDTTLMYALQVAAVALFATWGYLYGLVAALVPLFWGLGYFVMAWLVSSGHLDEFIQSDKFGTLHQFLAQGGKYPLVGKFAAVLTLLAISGPAMFEAFFTASIVERSLQKDSAVSTSALAFLFLIFSAVYMLRGGFAGAVRLDRIQLATGYVAFVALVAGLLATFVNGPNGIYAATLAIIVLLCALTLFIGRLRHARLVGQPDIFGSICTGVAVLICVWPLISYCLSGSNGVPTITFRELLFPDSFPFLAILSLLVANGLYQLVDVGQWQRLLSLNPLSSGINQSRQIISSSIKNIAIASPLTWIIAIVFGATLKLVSSSADAYQATHLLVDHILSLQVIEQKLLLGLLLISFVAIMFSTIDALVSATGFTITNDIFGSIADSSSQLLFDRFVTLGTLVAQLAFFLLVKKFAKDKTDAILYLCWSFQIAFAPAVIAALYKKDYGQNALIFSLFAGVIGAFAPLVFIGPASVYEYSPWCALVSATVGLYVITWIQTRIGEDRKKGLQ